MSVRRAAFTATLTVAAAASVVAAGVRSADAAPVASAPASTAAVAPAAASAPVTRDVILRNPYVAKDRLAKGWTVVRKASAKDVDPSAFTSCTQPSPAGIVRNTYLCGPSAAYAVACYKKTGYSNVLTCVVDPFKRQLAEYRTARPLPPTPATPAQKRRPIGATLATGESCQLRAGGSWSAPDANHVPWAWCGKGNDYRTSLYQRTDGSEQYRVNGRIVQYHAGASTRGAKLSWVNVTTRFWLG